MFELGNQRFDFNENNEISIPSVSITQQNESNDERVIQDGVLESSDILNIGGDAQEESFSWLLQKSLDEDDDK